MSTDAVTKDQMPRIRIGVILVVNQDVGRERKGQLEAFAEALSGALGTVVVPHSFTSYHELLESMHAGKLDFAWLPPIVALRAAARGRTIPVAIPIRGGTSSFSSVLFARPGSPIKTTSDLHKARVAWVDRESAAGYLVIRAVLRARDVDLDQAFGEELFLGSHDAVARAVLDGAADVGATFANADATLSQIHSAGWGSSAVHVIAWGGPIPNDVVGASIRVPVPRIRAVQSALCDTSRTDLRAASVKLFGADGFIEARSEHLDPLTHLLGYLEDGDDRE